MLQYLPMLTIKTLVNGPLEENCYLLSLEGSKEALLIDPGSSAPELERAVRSSGLKPVLILATHAHFDHVGAVAALAAAFGAPFAAHADDAPGMQSVEDMAMFYGLGQAKNPRLDRLLRHNDVVDAAGIRLKVIHTPGHTPGGVCYYHEESLNLFSGDTLFRGSIGRSDFEDGDGEALVKGIKSKLFVLPEAVKVHPGHGPATTLGDEKRDNPFVR